MTKPTKWHARPAKTQISLGIRPVWSESSLCTQWVFKDPNFLKANREDSNQTGRMSRLIWIFAGRTCHFVGFVMRRFVYELTLFLCILLMCKLGRIIPRLKKDPLGLYNLVYVCFTGVYPSIKPAKNNDTFLIIPMLTSTCYKCCQKC